MDRRRRAVFNGKNRLEVWSNRVLSEMIRSEGSLLFFWTKVWRAQKSKQGGYKSGKQANEVTFQYSRPGNCYNCELV